ncbi:MAG TPA: hypothetical protein VGG33_24465 [Polyangia bacterium]
MRFSRSLVLSCLPLLLACGKTDSQRPADASVDAGQSIPGTGGSAGATGTGGSAGGTGALDAKAMGGESAPEVAADGALPSTPDGQASTNDAASANNVFGRITWNFVDIEIAQHTRVTAGLFTSDDSHDPTASHCTGGQKIGDCCMAAKVIAEPEVPFPPAADAGAPTSPPDGGQPPKLPIPNDCAAKDSPLDGGTLRFFTKGTQVAQAAFSYAALEYGVSPLPAFRGPTPLWQAGDEVAVKGPGFKCVPPFEGTLSTAANPQVKLPAQVVLAEGFTVRWTPNPTTKVMRLAASGIGKDGNSMLMVKCEPPDARGEVAFPPALFKDFEPGGLSIYADRITEGAATLKSIKLYSRYTFTTDLRTR